MRKLIAGTGIAIVAVLLAASPAAAHFCQNVNKKYGAGAVTEEKIKVNPAGKEILPGAWADLGAIFGIAECEGQETNIHVFLHPAAEVGGDNGIQLLSEDCINALMEFFGEE
jgi:hypothetical protein